MKTYEEMRDRYIAQRDAREAAITATQDIVVKTWRQVIEDKMEQAFQGDRPWCSVSVYSNSLDVFHLDHVEEAIARGSRQLVEFFAEAGFKVRKIVCASGIGVVVAWDPDDN